jgi:uncharacterized protein (TIGR02118 family)
MYLSMLSLEPARTDAILPVVRELASLELCLVGTLRRLVGPGPDEARGVLVGLHELDDVRGLAGLGGFTSQTIAAVTELPLAPRRPGQRVYALVASFDYAPEAGDRHAAERHYLDHHVPESRKLPGLRGYFTGKLRDTGAPGERRLRMGIEVFDSRAALVAAFRTPLGEAMRVDGASLCGDVIVHHFDAEVVS